MKSQSKRIALLAASLMVFAVPVLADDLNMFSPAAEPVQQQQGGKNECLLVASNCTGSVDTLTEKIDRFQNEINKGTSVYSNDELRTLQNNLNDAKKTLSDLMQGGA